MVENISLIFVLSILPSGQSDMNDCGQQHQHHWGQMKWDNIIVFIAILVCCHSHFEALLRILIISLHLYALNYCSIFRSMQKCRSSFSSSGVAINRKVNTKCNHSPLIVQYLPVSKNFYPCCTAAIYNISLMFLPCKSLGYFPWTWMCFWPGSLDLLGWARLQTSSFPFLLSWIAFPYWCLNGSHCLQIRSICLN